LIELIHTVSGFGSLLTGLFVLLNTKGTKRHKLVGKAYVVFMLLLNITAFGIYELFNGFGIFHWAAIVSLLSILGGMVVLINRKNLKFWIIQHYYFMVWSYIGLLAGASNETFVHVPFFNHLAQQFSWAPMVSMFLIFFTGGAWVAIREQAITRRFIHNSGA